MAQDQVLQPQQQFGRERLAGQVRHLPHLLVEHLDADDQVADQLALVGVGEGPVVAQLAHLADVVQEDAHQQQVAVQLGVERREAVGGVEQRDDVLQQAAEVGVVVADAGRRLAEGVDELLVHQEALGQAAQVRVAELAAGAAQPFVELADVLLGVRQEVGQLDLLGLDALEVAEDHLQGALEELHLALDEEEIAGLEGAEQLFAGVPEAGADGAGAVAQLQLEVEVAVAVGPQLLVGDQVDFLDGVAVGHLLHETPRHDRRPRRGIDEARAYP